MSSQHRHTPVHKRSAQGKKHATPSSSSTVRRTKELLATSTTKPAEHAGCERESADEDAEILRSWSALHSWLHLVPRARLPNAMLFSRAEFEALWCFCPPEREELTYYGRPVKLGRKVRFVHWDEGRRSNGGDAAAPKKRAQLRIGGKRMLSQSVEEISAGMGPATRSSAAGMLQRVFVFANSGFLDERRRPMGTGDAVADGGGQDHQAAPRTVSGRYNSALINFYGEGSDDIGWHSDASTGCVLEVPVLSVSLGAPRRLRWKRQTCSKGSIGPGGRGGSGNLEDRGPGNLEGGGQKRNDVTGREGESSGEMWLRHGSLLEMGGRFQSEFLHSVPALTKRERGSFGSDDIRRISITLRAHEWVVADGEKK